MDAHTQSAVQLRIGDAVQLATALSQHVAHAAGIRTLVIKGPLAETQGLRPPRQSQDVDLLVDPARFDDLLDAFREYGWTPRPTPGFPLMLDLHSRTLVHPRWNCDIDIHHYWPGFIGDAGHIFDWLWDRRQALPIAGVDVDTPGLADSALVLALHSLREAGHADTGSRLLREYAAVVERVGSDEGLARAVFGSAQETGSLQTARPLLLAIGFDVPEDTNPSEELRRWQLHVYARHRMTAWLLEVRTAPFPRKLLVVWRAVFPTAEALRAIDPQIGDGARELIAGWGRRLARGLRLGPQAIRDLRGHYRSR